MVDGDKADKAIEVLDKNNVQKNIEYILNAIILGNGNSFNHQRNFDQANFEVYVDHKGKTVALFSNNMSRGFDGGDVNTGTVEVTVDDVPVLKTHVSNNYEVVWYFKVQISRSLMTMAKLGDWMTLLEDIVQTAKDEVKEKERLRQAAREQELSDNIDLGEYE